MIDYVTDNSGDMSTIFSCRLVAHSFSVSSRAFVVASLLPRTSGTDYIVISFRLARYLLSDAALNVFYLFQQPYLDIVYGHLHRFLFCDPCSACATFYCAMLC